MGRDLQVKVITNKEMVMEDSITLPHREAGVGAQAEAWGEVKDKGVMDKRLDNYILELT